MKRVLIHAIPLLVLGTGMWAGWHAGRADREGGGGVVMMLPGGLPELDPLMPAGEAARQLLDLVHEPMLRLDGLGRLAPALAEKWRWQQHVTCWFATQEAVQEAQRRLAEAAPSERQAWELAEVTVEGRSLVMNFSRPGAVGTEPALKAVASEALLPLTFLRLEAGRETRPALEAFVSGAGGGSPWVRLWFDDDGTCELVTTLPVVQAREALSEWLVGKGLPVPRIAQLAEVAGLLEPVLDFELSGSRLPWPDGTPVTAADVDATVRHVLEMGIPVPGREGLRHIQSITARGSSTVRVTYRRNYGAALAGWVGLPVLQQAWLEKNASGPLAGAPGAGPWVARRNSQGLSLERRKEADPETTPAVQIVSGSSARQARVALAAGALDIIWGAEDGWIRDEPALQVHPLPPANRLLVLLNTRSSRLSELPVREALSLAIDREALRVPAGAPVRPGRALFMPGLWYTPPAAESGPDLAAASRKLESAGWLKDVTGVAKKGGQVLEFSLLVTTGSADRERLAQALSRQWEALGVRVAVTLVEPEALVPDHLLPGRFDAVLLGLNYELSWDRTAFWHGRQTGGDQNYTRLADPQLDLLLDALAGEFDAALLPGRARAVQERFDYLRPALPLIGDLQEAAVRKARFPAHASREEGRFLSLRSLLRSGAGQPLRMRLPNE